MAALSLTELQSAIISAKGKLYNSFESRLSMYGAFKAFTDNSDMCIPTSVLEGAKLSAAQPVKIPTLSKFTASLLTSRACTITGANSTSGLTTLSFATKGFECAIYPSINAGNYISAEDDFANQFLNGIIAVAASLDTAAVAALEANKATTLTDSPDMATLNAGVYETTIDKFWTNAGALMEVNDLSGVFNNITNTESRATALKYESMGENNAQNLRAIMDGGLPSALNFRHYRSNRVSKGNYKEVHYLAPEGSLGLVTWNTFEAKNKVTSGDRKYYTLTDPFLGITWNVYELNGCADQSANYGAGAAAVEGTKYAITADFAFVTAYSSDGVTPIVKFGLA